MGILIKPWIVWSTTFNRNNEQIKDLKTKLIKLNNMLLQNVDNLESTYPNDKNNMSSQDIDSESTYSNDKNNMSSQDIDSESTYSNDKII